MGLHYLNPFEMSLRCVSFHLTLNSNSYNQGSGIRTDINILCIILLHYIGSIVHLVGTLNNRYILVMIK